MRLVDLDALRPGEKCFAQLRFSAPVAAIPGQRFILRGTRLIEGRGATLAGGRVLLVNPPRRRAGPAARLQRFAEAPLEERLSTAADRGGLRGPRRGGPVRPRPVHAEGSEPRAGAGSAKGAVVLVERERSRAGATPDQPGPATKRGPGPRRSGPEEGQPRASSPATCSRRWRPDRWRAWTPSTRSALSGPACPAKSCASAWASRLSGSSCAWCSRRLLESKKVELIDELLRLPGRGRAFTEAAAAHQSQLARPCSRAASSTRPRWLELESALRLPAARTLELCQSLVSRGQAVRAGELFFARSAIDRCSTARLLAHTSRPTRSSAPRRSRK